MGWQFFTKRPSILDQLTVDVHAHLIPGIDDGVKSMEESLACISTLSKIGFKKLVVTPHIMGDYYPNTQEKILDEFHSLEHEIKRSNLTVQCTVAAEYFLDDFFLDLLEKDKPLLTLHRDLLLIELSTFIRSDHVLDAIFQLQSKGYRPVLAHPERYLYYAKEMAFLRKLKELGCLFQANILSFNGHYGNEVRKFGLTLLRQNFVDYLGTDLHRLDHAIQLQKLKRTPAPKFYNPEIIKNNNLLD